MQSLRMPNVQRVRPPRTDDFVARPIALDFQPVLVESPACEALPVDQVLKCSLIHKSTFPERHVLCALTSGVRRVRLRTSPARPGWATGLSLSTPEWIDSQLHAPSDRICCAPLFHHTAAGNAIQIDTAPCAVLSRWFDAAPCAQVSPFGRHPQGHPLAFGHDLRGTTRDIWKRGTDGTQVSLHSSRPRRCVVGTVVIHR